MALYNLTDGVYLPNWNVWARPVIVTPLVSQPGAPAYDARGYYDTKELDILAEGGAVISDAQSYLDILLVEFPILPRQGDLIGIPDHQGVPGGDFMVLDLAGSGNAGGMTTLQLRRYVTNKPELPPP